MFPIYLLPGSASVIVLKVTLWWPLLGGLKPNHEAWHSSFLNNPHPLLRVDGALATQSYSACSYWIFSRLSGLARLSLSLDLIGSLVPVCLFPVILPASLNSHLFSAWQSVIVYNIYRTFKFYYYCCGWYYCLYFKESSQSMGREWLSPPGLWDPFHGFPHPLVIDLFICVPIPTSRMLVNPVSFSSNPYCVIDAGGKEGKERPWRSCWISHYIMFGMKDKSTQDIWLLTTPVPHTLYLVPTPVPFWLLHCIQPSA